jgi:hypothetical protein
MCAQDVDAAKGGPRTVYALNKMLVSCEDPEALLTIVDCYLDELNNINLATAVHRSVQRLSRLGIIHHMCTIQRAARCVHASLVLGITLHISTFLCVDASTTSTSPPRSTGPSEKTQ